MNRGPPRLNLLPVTPRQPNLPAGRGAPKSNPKLFLSFDYFLGEISAQARRLYLLGPVLPQAENTVSLPRPGRSLASGSLDQFGLDIILYLYPLFIFIYPPERRLLSRLPGNLRDHPELFYFTTATFPVCPRSTFIY